MKLSLRAASASILGPCLFAFIIGHLSSRSSVFNQYDLSSAVKDALDYSSVTEFLSSGLWTSSHIDSTDDESVNSMQIKWKQYLDESVSGLQSGTLSGQSTHNDDNRKEGADLDPQQILVDLKNVDSAFLESESVLENGLVKFMEKLGITVFTYECHQRFYGKGVSCVGHAEQAFVSLDTWPSAGLLSLNVLSNVHDSLGSFVPIASEIFASPTASPANGPSLTWLLKRRGVKVESVLSWMTHKPAPSPSRMFDSISDSSYSTASFTIDGVNIEPLSDLQVEKRSTIGHNFNTAHYNIVYAESLVHPAMFAHSDPKNVAIFGNGTGVALREVLKHTTVEKVVLVGSDSNFVQRSMEAFPQFSDCSMIEGLSQCCYDDARVEMLPVDTMEWLVDNDDIGRRGFNAQFDVIIFETRYVDVRSKVIRRSFSTTSYFRST